MGFSSRMAESCAAVVEMGLCRALITAGKQSIEVFEIKWALKHLVPNGNQLHT